MHSEEGTPPANPSDSIVLEQEDIEDNVSDDGDDSAVKTVEPELILGDEDVDLDMDRDSDAGDGEIESDFELDGEMEGEDTVP